MTNHIAGWASLYSRALTTICVDEVPRRPAAPRSRPTTVRQGNGGLLKYKASLIRSYYKIRNHFYLYHDAFRVPGTLFNTPPRGARSACVRAREQKGTIRHQAAREHRPQHKRLQMLSARASARLFSRGRPFSQQTLHLGTWLRLLRPGGPWVAPYVPTATEVAKQLLSLARLAPGETMCDLGCGDGRMLNMAVHEFGAARAIGYELDTALAASARDLAAGDPRIEIRCEDFFEGAAAVLAEADVVALYLSETGNAKLLPLLRQHLRPSARVVSNVWEMPVPPSRTLHAKGSNVPLHLFERAALDGSRA